MSMTRATAPAGRSAPSFRWIQLILGIICMSAVANLQYAWTLFVLPIQHQFGWSKAEIQVAFTIFILCETWLVPAEGWVVDRIGPRWMILAGGIGTFVAWFINANATQLWEFYVAGGLAGFAGGAVYGTSVGNALKWFPDHRGFAAGLTAAGFGAGSALTIIPIANMIHAQGYEHTFFVFGIGQGVVVVILGFLLLVPPASILTAAAKLAPASGRAQADWHEMIRTPVFWLMYVMFVLMAAGGLMATAQLGPIAKDFKIDTIPVSILGLTLPALTFALTIDRVLNGLTRPFFGWVSDHIGRENTMFIAFALEGIGIFALYKVGNDPLLFVILSGLVFFAWGEIYSLFPATVTDTYGAKYATTNTGLMYTAKGTASLLVPLANVLSAMTGSWQAVFLTAAAMNILAALLALFVLKPMRAAYTSKPAIGAPVSMQGAARQQAAQRTR